MAEQGGFGISVLSERTGVPVPTIHHYRRLGLLPEPTALASNRFLYDRRHVESLTLIRLLRQQRNLPLATIGAILPDLLCLGAAAGRPVRALRPAAWDDVLNAYVRRSAPSSPPARLLGAAREIFATHGYAAAQVSEICDRAGIAKGSFYRYFDSKEAIFAAAARSTACVVGDALDELPRQTSAAQATGVLQELLAPLAPLLLEVATRGLRGDEDSLGVIADLSDALAARVGPRLRTGARSSASCARQVVDAALLGLLRAGLGLSPS